MSNTPNASVTHIIFDFDGTLVNSMDVYINGLREIARRFDKPWNPIVESEMINIMSWSSLMASFAHKIGLSGDVDLIELEAEVKSWARKANDYELMPGVERLVRHCHGHGIPMAIASGSGSAQLTAIAAHFELFEPKRYISHHVCGDDSELMQNKPNPIYWLCAKRFATPPNDVRDVLVFEDSTTGITGAVASGMRSVWVRDKRLQCESDMNATLVIDSLNEFQPQLFGLPPFQ